MSEADGHCERAIGIAACMVEEVLLGLVEDLFVIVHLIGTNTRTGLEDTGCVVVPFEPAVRFVPVDGPSIVAGVDVGSQTLLETVKLVADEMHLASKDSLVSGRAKVVA